MDEHILLTLTEKRDIGIGEQVTMKRMKAQFEAMGLKPTIIVLVTHVRW